MMSLIPYIYQKETEEVIHHNEIVDGFLIKNIFERHEKTIIRASHIALLPCLVSLCIINEFSATHIDALKTPRESLRYALKSEFWLKIFGQIEKSRECG